MPVFKYDDIELQKINMDGVDKMTGVNLISNEQGWDGNILRVFCLSPGGHTPKHSHDWEHVNYVIKGKGRLTIGDKVNELSAQDFAFVPPNKEHQFENPYDEDFEFICIIPVKEEQKY